MLIYDYSNSTENDLASWLFLNPKAIEILNRINKRKGWTLKGAQALARSFINSRDDEKLVEQLLKDDGVKVYFYDNHFTLILVEREDEWKELESNKMFLPDLNSELGTIEVKSAIAYPGESDLELIQRFKPNGKHNWHHADLLALVIHRLNVKKIVILDRNLEIQKVYFQFNGKFNF